jgi:hypothetical protein
LAIEELIKIICDKKLNFQLCFRLKRTWMINGANRMGGYYLSVSDAINRSFLYSLPTDKMQFIRTIKRDPDIQFKLEELILKHV